VTAKGRWKQSWTHGSAKSRNCIKCGCCLLTLLVILVLVVATVALGYSTSCYMLSNYADTTVLKFAAPSVALLPGGRVSQVRPCTRACSFVPMSVDACVCVGGAGAD
jgi:hypothetical protein